MEEAIVGKTIGIYEVLYMCERSNKYGARMYHVRCVECGWESNFRKQEIMRGARKCVHVGYARRYKRTGGKRLWGNNRLGNIFNGVKSRCYNPKDNNYRVYGEKGVRVCDEWLDNPALFEEWAINNGYKDWLTLDRIDASGNYCPENCRWVRNEENARFKTTTRRIEIDGEVYSGRGLAKKLGVGPNTINRMMREHGGEKVVDFAVEREKDMSRKRKGKESWFDVYGIEA